MTPPARGPVVFELVVWGQPAGSGSKVPMPKGRMVGKRFKPVLDKIGRPVFYVKPSSEKTEPWMKKVKQAAEAEWGDRGPLDGALYLEVAFYELRPKDHFHADGRLKATAPAYPHQTNTHDRDKMVRAISDSLTNAGVIADDKRLVAGPSWKLYADYPPFRACAVVQIRYMRHQTVEEAEIPSPPPDGQETLA